MIGLAVNYANQVEREAKAARRATYRLINKAAFETRKTAIDSIEPGEGPSEPGTPPHTHTQKLTKRGKVRKGRLPKAILYKSEREEAVVGPAHSLIGTVGAAHEFGGEYKDQDYPERPFMGPALISNLEAFGNSFAGSIGE
ncbi:hypothetical protein NA78x_001725 [Anatilimnocola sp. NA78]|uniref:hypothetical protein n=1 Tax=Anatilimnocola sp. NA78 TaxID=3415683 RepID=UPI003CE5A7CF